MFYSRKKIIITLLAGVCIILTGSVAYYKHKKQLERERVYIKLESAYLSSYNITPIEFFLISDLQKRTNDVYTKKAMYAFVHHYINSGGNIYGISNSINTNKEFSFLLDAKEIYPEYFALLEAKKVPRGASDEGMYIYLAYLETSVKHGYADTSLLSELIYRYAQMANYKTVIRKDKEEGKSITYPDYPLDIVLYDRSKSAAYIPRMDSYVVDIIKPSFLKRPLFVEKKHDKEVLYTLLRYASALRYLEGSGYTPMTTLSAQDVFSFLVTETYHNHKELYGYVTLLNAVTLLSTDVSDVEIRNALYPIISVGTIEGERNALIASVIDAKKNKNLSRFQDVANPYSHFNITLLAKRVSEFKTWLLENGWRDIDFDL